MPNQARRKNAVIVSFLLDLDTLTAIDTICTASAQTCREPLTRSSWIKRAIARDLAHRERAARSRRKEAENV